MTDEYDLALASLRSSVPPVVASLASPRPRQPAQPRSSRITFQPPDANWSLDRLPQIQTDFQSQFGKPLPLANKGQGSIHNKWGYDHRNAADVSLDPSTREGQRFGEYLRQQNIPFLAFTSAIPGVATGPHYHLGAPSHKTNQRFVVGAQVKNPQAPQSGDVYDQALQDLRTTVPQPSPSPSQSDEYDHALSELRGQPLKTPQTSVMLGEGAIDETTPLPAAKPIEFTQGNATPRNAGPTELMMQPFDQPQARGTVEEQLTQQRYKTPPSTEMAQAVKIPFSPHLNPTEDDLVTGYLNALGPNYAKFGEKYKRETGRNILSLQPGDIDRDPDGSIYVQPSRAAVDVLNAYVQSGGDINAAKAEGVRIAQERRGAVTTAEQQAAPDIAEVQAARTGLGTYSGATRAIESPIIRYGAGKLSQIGGLISGFGVAPNKLSDYLNTRGKIMELGSTLPPLTPQGKEIQRGVPEKVGTALGDLGLGVFDVVAMKRATGLSIGQIMALEAALKDSDAPVPQRAASVAQAYAMGKILDGHLDRITSAGIFAVPAGVEGAQSALNAPPEQRKEAALDAILNTAIQGGFGAIMGGGKENDLRLPEVQARESLGIQRASNDTVEPLRYQDLRTGETFSVNDSGQKVVAEGAARTPGEFRQPATVTIRPPVEGEAPQRIVPYDEYLKAPRDAKGHVDQSALLGPIQQQMDAAIKAGRKVELVLPDENKRVPVTRMVNGMAEDAKGNRWGIASMLFPKQGGPKDYIEIASPSLELTAKEEASPTYDLSKYSIEPTAKPEALSVESSVSGDEYDQALATLRATPEPQPREPLPPVKTLATGNESRVSTDRGSEVNTRYAIADAKDLVTSHDEMLRPNPDFPAELQPRQRDRAASAEQINRMASGIRPEYLGESPKASEGAPIVGPDGVVESGNGRVLALRQAYDTQKAEPYRQFLTDNAEKFGVDKNAISSTERPVLIRVRTSEVDRPQFVREANEQSIASMSAPEQAKSDAQKITGPLLSTFAPSESGEINTAQNTNFIRAFMRDVVGPNELGRYVGSKGEISQDGLTRIRNAIFARAYGDSPEGLRALEKIAESPDNNVRNITNALLQRAGAFASLKEGIAKGDRYPLDVTNDLTKALGKLSSLRESGITVGDYLDQGALFGQDLTPLQQHMLYVFDGFKRSAKTISEILDGYVQGAEAAGSPKQQGFFGAEPPRPEELFEAAVREAVDENNKQAGLFATKDKGLQPKSTAREPVPSPYPSREAAPVKPATVSPAIRPAIERAADAPSGSALRRALDSESGKIDLDLLTLGMPEFMRSDVAPRTRAAYNLIKQGGQGIKALLAPPSVSPQAGETARIIGENASKMARGLDIADQTLRGAHDFYESKRSLAPMPGDARVRVASEGSRHFLEDATTGKRSSFSFGSRRDAEWAMRNLDVIDRIERGQRQADPKQQAFADTFRALLDGRRAAVQSLGPDLLQKFYTDYFPHLWKQPADAERVMQQTMGKRPFEGPKSFLKPRTVPTTLDGVMNGLEPISFNPVDLLSWKLREMDKFVMAHRSFSEIKDQGMLKFIKSGPLPEGYDWINDKIAQVFGRTPPTDEQLTHTGGEDGKWQFEPSGGGELILRGRYAAPAPVARILNNYLSPGLTPYALYRGWRFAGNLLNQVQLGFSFYHAGFTALDSVTSRFAAGLEDIAKYGKPGRGLLTTASAPIAPLKNLVVGSKMLKEWYAPGSQGEYYGKLIDSLVQAGGRAKMDQFYATLMTKSMTNAFRRGNIPGGLLRAPFAAVEKLAAPTMEWWVPRQKMGVFAEMAKREIEKLGPDAPHEQVRAAMAKAWDSVDNRMGQMVYDRLFWNKTFKDLALASVRSVGWNLGTFREIGGGGLDYARALRDITLGLPTVEYESPTGRKTVVSRKRQFELTHRMAYVAALPIVVGTLGAITQYALTGHGPTELKDYFFPRTGATDENGRPERLSYPSYIKDLPGYRDIYKFGPETRRTLANKAHPLIGLVSEMLQNRDYYGTEIRNQDDPFMKQIIDEAKHVGGAFDPIAARNFQQERERGASLTRSLLPFVGVTPARSDINMTAAERMLREIMRARPTEARTQEAAAKSSLKRTLIRQRRQGVDVEPSLNDYAQKGTLTDRDLSQIYRESGETPLQVEFHRLSLRDAERVYRVMTQGERSQVDEILNSKRLKRSGAQR